MQNLDILLSSILEEVKRIVLDVGAIQRSYFDKQIEIRQKTDKTLVTNVDIESDEYLRDNLQPLIKDASFLTEESGLNNKKSDFLWVIDPLDGTRNFVCGIPHFSISIALIYKHEPVMGIIYDPSLNELFYAQKSKGAFLNGKPLKIKNREELDNRFILGLCGPSTTYEASLLYKMIEKSGGDFSYRKFGSAALNMAYVAASRFSSSLCLGVSWWDVAAGVIIVLEAGGLNAPISFDANSKKVEKFFTSDRNTFTKMEHLIS